MLRNMGVTDDLTLSEKEALYELKARLENEMTTEMKNDNETYLRFLRARDFKVDLAEDMLRKCINWRKANNIDSIATDYVLNKVIVEHVPLTRIGFDKEGAPIRFFDFGVTDTKGLLKAARKNDVVKTIVSYFEEDVKVMKEQSVKLGKSIQQWTYILDFEGYSFAKATHKPTIECLLALFQTYEANYPERLKAAFVINSSLYFTILYSVIKPLLSGATVRKIAIYGKDGWKNELLKLIDPEVLPAFLGGKRTDPDGNPLCQETVLHGKFVPEELYMCKSENRISSQPGAKRLIVSRKSKALLPLQVNEPDSMIEWEFETESRDIDFALCYKENDTESSETKELVPKQRIDAHLLSEGGVYKCANPGTYLLVFDNSYSWIHRKEIYCKVSVLTPSGKVQPC